MPEISRFFGIIIRMFFDDHNPPHFHVEYGGRKAVFDLRGNVLQGDLGSKVALGEIGSIYTLLNWSLIGSWQSWENHLKKFVLLNKGNLMWNLNDVKKIKYRRPYVYFIEFDDGVKGEVDLSFLLVKGPIFKPLHSIKLFRSAHIEGGTISWPNGADIAPETLYEAIKGRMHSSRRIPRRRAA